MDANDADKVFRRKRPRSSTVSFAREITRGKDYYQTGTDERRTKSASSVRTDDFAREDYGLYFTRTLPGTLRSRQKSSSGRDYEFGSLKIIKQRRDTALRSLFNQDGKLKDDTETGYGHFRTRSTVSTDSQSTDESPSIYSNSEESDVSARRDSGCEDSVFTAEDVIHLENSIRMSQLQNKKKVSFDAEELLHDAIQRDDVDELCDLLTKERYLDLEKPNRFGITPLHRAAIDGGYRCLAFLLSRNVNVKVRDMYGWTPLHDAVYHGHIRCAAALITAGADVEAETNDFIKPIEITPDDEMLLLVGRAMTSPGYVYDQDRETLV